ncbi:MAG: hypothetical protein ABFS38_14205 [Bacteroidota bacterium]
MVLELFGGPMLSYQSNVFDINHYQVPEGSYSEPVSQWPDIIYLNQVEEWLFFGGMAGFRLSARTGTHW